MVSADNGYNIRIFISQDVTAPLPNWYTNHSKPIHAMHAASRKSTNPRIRRSTPDQIRRTLAFNQRKRMDQRLTFSAFRSGSHPLLCTYTM